MIKSKFPRCINRNSIETMIDYENDRCYKIAFKMHKRGKSRVLVISRAPRVCDERYIKRVIQRMARYLECKRDTLGSISEVTLVNLFVPFEYDRASIYNLMVEKGERFVTGNDNLYTEEKIIKNDEVIKNEINNSDFVILAWGEALKDIEPLYNERTQFVLQTIRKFNVEANYNKETYIVGGLTRKGYTRHYMNWTSKDELERFIV